jgi:hypothetical protein
MVLLEYEEYINEQSFYMNFSVRVIIDMDLFV